MRKKLGLLTLHGMGRQEPGYARDLFDRVKEMIGTQANEVCYKSVYFQDLLGSKQAEMFGRMRPYIDWKWLREFIVHWFSDATSLESRKGEEGSAYIGTQKRIMDALDYVYRNINDHGPVVIVASSLGCQVISNYIWDAQRKERKGAPARLRDMAPKGGVRTTRRFQAPQEPSSVVHHRMQHPIICIRA